MISSMNSLGHGASSCLGAPPSSETAEEACKALLGERADYCVQGTPAHIGFYDRERLARPSGACQPVPLEKLLTGAARDVYDRFLTDQLLGD